jgi:ribosomal protein L29
MAKAKKTTAPTTVTELRKQESKNRARLAEITRERYIKELKNVREIRKLKRERAHILTLISQKEKEN